MPEISQITSYVGYAPLLLLGVAYIVFLFLGPLTSVETNIDVTQRQEYRKAIVLENLLSLDGQTSQYGYEYTHRRGVIPVEYFSNRNPEGSELGHKVTGNQVDHCYIDRVAGLDGENFAFRIKPLADEDKGSEGNDLGTENEDYKSVKTLSDGSENTCVGTEPQITQISVVSTAMLVRKSKNNSMLPVRLYVYDRGSYTYIPDVGAP